jgi:hypothetical protein
VKHGPLHVQAELIANDRDYRPGARATTRGGFAADGSYIGAYALVGYRLDRWWQVMPFTVLEIDRNRPNADTGTDPLIVQATAGLNFRPEPSVALKVEYIQAHSYSRLVDLDLDIRILMTQAAWAF